MDRSAADTPGSQVLPESLRNEYSTTPTLEWSAQSHPHQETFWKRPTIPRSNEVPWRKPTTPTTLHSADGRFKGHGGKGFSTKRFQRSVCFGAVANLFPEFVETALSAYRHHETRPFRRGADCCCGWDSAGLISVNTLWGLRRITKKNKQRGVRQGCLKRNDRLR